MLCNRITIMLVVVLIMMSMVGTMRHDEVCSTIRELYLYAMYLLVSLDNSAVIMILAWEYDSIIYFMLCVCDDNVHKKYS